MGLKFTWDEDKNIENQIKHGIAFEEVVSLFATGNYDVTYDREHSTQDEDRWLAVGILKSHGITMTVFTEVVDDTIRIISARKLR